MEARVIITTELELKAIIADAVSAAFRYNQPQPSHIRQEKGSLLNFQALMQEYYPGIPESTVRQDTASLGRTKVGKRILFERSDVEAHLRSKRQASAAEIDQQAGNQFDQQHSRRGGRKAS